jgi:hypothetical protein
MEQDAYSRKINECFIDIIAIQWRMAIEQVGVSTQESY